MKKVMFGLVAAAAMVACADIESSNIVGYASAAMTDGCKMLTSQFVTIGSTGTDIQTIKGDGDDLYDFSIQLLDAYGRTTKSFSWDDWSYDTAMWVDDDGGTEYTVAPGQGLWVQAKSGYTMTSAGEVQLKDVVVGMVDGCVAVGNPFPIAVNIQDLVGTGDDLYDFSIQILDAYGRTAKSFSWDDWSYDTAMWVDDDGATEYSVAPGEGLWVQGKAGYTLRIPAPEVK